MEIYAINADGLVYEENLNFGPVFYKPAIVKNLDVSILNDLSTNACKLFGLLKLDLYSL